jgi:mannonate dehydratase
VGHQRQAGRDARVPAARRQVSRLVPKMFEHLGVKLGEDIELLHDVHERMPPIQAIGLAKELEQYHLFFLEDLFAPEDSEYFRIVRQQTSTPLAIGELFSNQAEYVPLIRDRVIDFIRVRVTTIGGHSMARNWPHSASFLVCEPPGMAPEMSHRWVTRPICTWPSHATISGSRSSTSSARPRAVFHGTPEIRDGAMWPNDRPGLGVDIDEELAAKFPFPDHAYNGAWPEIRRLDGTVIRP